MSTQGVFHRVRLDTFEESACSPEVDDAFRGVRIDAPGRIHLSEEAPPFPLCGTYRVSAAFLNRFHSMANEIVVVAVDATSHRPRSTNLLEPGFDPRPSHFDEKTRGFERIAITGWFNLDLFHWMDDLPRRAGRHHVFATVGDVVSNVITVEMVA